MKKFFEDREFYMNLSEVLICTAIAGGIVLFSGEPDIFDAILKFINSIFLG